MIQELKQTLGGEERTFTFGLTFLGEVTERYDPLTLPEIILKAAKFPAKYVPALMFESLRNSCIMDGKTIDFTEVDVLKWLQSEDNYGAEFVNEYLSVFLNTNENKTPESEIKEDDNTEVLKKK